MQAGEILAIGGLLLGMRGKGKGPSPSTGIGTYPRSGNSRALLSPIWKDGGTLYKIELDFPWSDDMRNQFCGPFASTYGPVHFFNCRRGALNKRHWNPDWAEVENTCNALVAVVGVLTGGIGGLVLAVVEAVLALVGFISYYDETYCLFCVAKTVGTSHEAITQAIRDTFPEIDELFNLDKVTWRRHYGTCAAVNWDKPGAMLRGKEEIEGHTVEFRPWDRYQKEY